MKTKEFILDKDILLEDNEECKTVAHLKNGNVYVTDYELLEGTKDEYQAVSMYCISKKSIHALYCKFVFMGPV